MYNNYRKRERKELQRNQELFLEGGNKNERRNDGLDKRRPSEMGG